MKNPPAFPRGAYDNHFGADGIVNSPGMTLRDYFAARFAAVGYFHFTSKQTPQEIAVKSYLLADAMLEARDAS
jgi:hypothetical protein